MTSKVSLIKKIDSILGPIVIALLRSRGSEEKFKGTVRSVLFIRPGGIGDAVLLLPAINAVKSKFPVSEVDLLCEKRNAGVFDLVKGIRRTYLYDKGFGLLECLRNGYDVVIDTEQWHRLSAVVAYCTKAPVRIGFSTNERGRLFTHKISYSHDEYEIYSFLHLVEPLTGPMPDFEPGRPFIYPADEISLSLLPSDPARGDKLVAIFPGASVAQRRWGGERFGMVAKALAGKGYKIIILGSGADLADAEKITEFVKDSIDLTGRTTLKEVAAILKRCRLLVAADSGLLHIAYAAGTPTVSLFGSGIEKKWAPQGGNHVVINKRFDCSPCTRFGYTPRCASGAACLSAITVEEVLAAAEQILF